MKYTGNEKIEGSMRGKIIKGVAAVAVIAICGILAFQYRADLTAQLAENVS